jgi:hypothetical protein
MIHILFILVCSMNGQDSVTQPLYVRQQAYRKHIAINGLLSIGLTATSGIYWKKGNDAYAQYQKSTTTVDALYYWEQTQGYDRIRNVCAIGALFFIGRTIYYYAKLMDSYKKVGVVPHLDVGYTHNGTMSFGIVKKF